METYRPTFIFGFWYIEKLHMLMGIIPFWVRVRTKDGYVKKFYTEAEAWFHIQELKDGD